jgi:hypothetical protein
MTYAVRAWKDGTGKHGITIGTVEPFGHDNVVAEVDIDDAEFDAFIGRCHAARLRAREAPGRLDEKLPGAYESWAGREEA